MAIEDIQTPKAPANWKPSADQQQQIASDRRLQGMSRDDLYAYFDKPDFSSAFRQRAGQQQQQQRASGGGMFGGVLNRVTNAMRGK